MSRKSRRAAAPVEPEKPVQPVVEPTEPAEASGETPAADEDRLDLAAIAARLSAREAERDRAEPAPEPVSEAATEAADPTDQSDPTDPSDQPEPAEVPPTDSTEPAAAAEEGPEAVIAEPQLSGAEVFAAVEALLFAADRPLTVAQLARALPSGIGAREVRQQLAAIAETLADAERGFELREIAGGWQLLTREKFAPFVQRLKRAVSIKKLSGSALETLAVVAYKQPVGRAEIERIRGVNAGEMLRSLLEKRLVRIAGRSEQLGNALLYGTTQEFLEHFGLKSIADLPRSAELSRKPAVKPTGETAAPQTPGEAAASIGLVAPAAPAAPAKSAQPDQTDRSDQADPSDQSATVAQP